ncbi:MAG: hypothetical protein IPM48_14650 [Saprospiraceae bacterium]|nr:hypothetical protein [Saprospiraceae bacterium]
MNKNELIKNFANRAFDEERTRQKGRYWASDVKSIIGGWLTPENFFEKREMNLQSCRNVITGNALERIYHDILEYNKIEHVWNPKYELKIDDFVVVVKPDFVLKDRVEETKYIVSGDYTSYEYQLECEHRATNLPVYYAILESPFDITHKPFTPSEERWEFIQQTLRDFHSKLSTVSSCNPH